MKAKKVRRGKPSQSGAKQTARAVDHLSSQGRELLAMIVNQMRTNNFLPGDPSTYLGYKQCCVALGIAPPDADVPWGRLLQKHGLTELNEWTKRNQLPRIGGLIVNQAGERQYFPGGDFFASNGRPDMDGAWWEAEARSAAKFDWTQFM